MPFGGTTGRIVDRTDRVDSCSHFALPQDNSTQAGQHGLAVRLSLLLLQEF